MSLRIVGLLGWIWLLGLPQAQAARSFASLDGPRVALVVGHKRGDSRTRPLRFAHRDAKRFVRVLKEIGGYKSKDIHLLLSPTRQKLQATMKRLARTLKKRKTGMFLFYYSGHARAGQFLLGTQKMAFAQMVRYAKGLPSRVRLMIIDSCYSGGAIQSKGAKGLRRKSTIRWRVPYWPSRTRGLAILASSGAREQSYESEQLRGSFFTSHLLIGLRGAADLNRDHRVSLSEIRQYVYLRTLSHSISHRTRLQRPTHQIRLRGQGLLFLTYLQRAQAQLSLPRKLEGACFLFRKGRLLYEFQKPANKAISVGLPQGSYELRIRRRGWVGYYRTTLSSRQKRRVALGSIRWQQATIQQQVKGSAGALMSTGLGLLLHYTPTSTLSTHGIGGSISLVPRRWLHLGLRYQFGAVNPQSIEYTSHDLGLRIAFGYGLGWERYWGWLGAFIEPGLSLRQQGSQTLANATGIAGLVSHFDYHMSPRLAFRLSLAIGIQLTLFALQTRSALFLESGVGVVWRL